MYLPVNTFGPIKSEVRAMSDEVGEEDTSVIYFVLENETPFSAFQTDVYLPAGLPADMESIGLTDRGDYIHTVSAKAYSQGDGTTMLRVVGFSPEMHDFTGDTGILLTVPVDADDSIADVSEVRTANTIFSTSDGREYRLDDASAEVVAYRPENPDIPVSSIILSQHEITLDPGEELTLEVEILPEDATDRTVTWTSADETVATVNVNGTVKALTPGKTLITVAAADGSGLSDSCEVIVRDFETSIVAPEATPIKIRRDNGMITVGGLRDGVEVRVCTLDGIELIRMRSEGGEVTIPAERDQTLILRIGDRTFKVM